MSTPARDVDLLVDALDDALAEVRYLNRRGRDPDRLASLERRLLAASDVAVALLADDDPGAALFAMALLLRTDPVARDRRVR